MIRKIQTAGERERKKKRNQIIIGIVLIGIMVISTAGYAIVSNRDETQTKVAFGNFEFVKQQDFWVTSFGDNFIYLQYLPQDVENVSVSGIYTLDAFSNKPLYYVTSNPGAGEILNNIRNIERYQEVCIQGINCTGNELPVKSCNDNIFVFKPASGEPENEIKTKVYQSDNCIYIEGDFIKGADAFLYRLYGIA